MRKAMKGFAKNIKALGQIVLLMLIFAVSMLAADFALAKDGYRFKALLAQALKQTPAAAKSVKIRILDEKQYAEAIKDAKTIVLVDFYADWCGPCRNLGPTIQKLADQYDGKVVVVKVNVDKAQKLVQNLGIGTIPTVLIVNAKGEELERFVGALGFDKYKARLDHHLQQEAAKKTAEEPAKESAKEATK